MQPKLDYFILLLPQSTLHNFPSWITTNFTISPGGKHADNLTENKLIILKDGSYIELISFIDDENPSDDQKKQRKGHWWGQLENGWIDWALTTDDVDDLKGLRSSFDKAKISFSHEHSASSLKDETQGYINYLPPKAGSRIRPDKEILKWFVSFAQGNRVRAEIPFWCHDSTDRLLRVPCDDPDKINHPCGAVGVGDVRIYISEKEKEAFIRGYDVLLGKENRVDTIIKGEEGEKGKAFMSWNVGTVKGGGRSRISLVEADDNDRFGGKFGSLGQIDLFVDDGEWRAGLEKEIKADVGGKEVRIGFVKKQ